MGKEEIELFPSGLLSCFVDGTEVRVLKVSKEDFTIRVCEKLEKINEVMLSFYNFNEYGYTEIKLTEYKLIEIMEEDFYFKYMFSIDDNKYKENVERIFRDYSKYIMLKTFGDENEFSKEMVGYPAEKDYEFYDYYCEQKKDWLSNLNYENCNEGILESLEIAVKLDNYKLYKNYLHKDINRFKEDYIKENFVKNHMLFKKNISRIYIGNEFCHNLFPQTELLMNMIKKCANDNLNITLCFTYMRDNLIEETKNIIGTVYDWCIKNGMKIEVVINDWGMIKLLEDKTDYFTLSLGVLLNKRKKDPRYIYKKGYEKNKDIMSENNLNSKIFSDFLKENKIERYEYENCGYEILIGEGKHSLQMPFYVTNTSQYCTLYAMCKNLDRGSQKLVSSCPKYCMDYVFAYPKHLKMVGKYNSLFAFDDTLLKDNNMLEKYVNMGIDRIVFNFM
ncbi:hypothetical protein AB2T96_07970 [Clostridium butyricum]|uniref:hypothetical protein n=1 Tax=Clostridium butyricum TaxID=1492 RepID=UPI0018AA4845|nr:hypothetical protein [Clostridium butyricum]MDB2156309.1 hypothetical protein [Clostridium butyricum]